MTVKELAERLSLKALAQPDEAREVLGCYAGDLLSWVFKNYNIYDIISVIKEKEVFRL